MLRILEAEMLSYLLCIHLGIKKLAFSYIHHLKLYIFLCRLSSFRFNEISKIIWRKTNLISKIFNCGYPKGLSHTFLKVIINKLFKAAHSAGVHFLPCYKLAFIESHTIIQHNFDVGYDERFGEFVYGMLELTFNFFHVILQNDPLFS